MEFNLKKKQKKQNRNKIIINWQIRDQGTDSNKCKFLALGRKVDSI